MKNILIEQINITAFRNLKDTHIDCRNKDLVMIKGNNMQGKTNVLNAIYWCLTGTDLNGSNDNARNIPYGTKFAMVEVATNAGRFIRVVNKVENKYETHIYINGDEKPTKQAENIILESFELLQASLKDTKSFKILRFLLNPLYYLTISQKDLREYVIKLVDGDKSELDVLKTLSDKQLSHKVSTLVASGITAHGSVAKFYKSLTDAESKIKTELTQLDCVKSYCEARNFTDFDADIEAKQKKLNKDKMLIAEKKVGIDEFVKYLNEYLTQTANNKNLGIVFIEKGQNEDVYTEVCYPHLLNTDLPIKNGSTAETIYLSCLFVNTIRSLLGLGSFPMLIDEGETIDNKTLVKLQNDNKCQMIATFVEYFEMKGIRIL